MYRHRLRQDPTGGARVRRAHDRAASRTGTRPGTRKTAGTQRAGAARALILASVLASALLASAGLAATTARASAGGHLPPPARGGAGSVAGPATAALDAALDVGARRVAQDDLARIHGGFCTTCSDGGSGGGGGGGTGSSGSPTATGSPYWETYRVSLSSSSTTPPSLVNKINNYSDYIINGTFQYTRKIVRDVQFSGGYASFVKASIGGEVSQSTQTSVTYPIAPHTYGKLYVKYRTERRTYYGHQYQDFTDGTRTVVGSESGPYLSTSTVLGYVTGAL